MDSLMGFISSAFILISYKLTYYYDTDSIVAGNELPADMVDQNSLGKL